MKRAKVFVIILSLAICVADGYVWQSILPPARNFARMVVDSINQRAILFGGHGDDNCWHNNIWQIPLGDSLCYYLLPLKLSGMMPSGRGGEAFVYVPNQQKVYAICGDTYGNCSGLVNEVWALRLTPGAESWQQLYPSGTPPCARRQIDGIYCPARNSIIFFGGEGVNTTYDDLWELKLEPLMWQSIPVSGTRPGTRATNAIAYNRANNRMIIFGGGYNGGYYNDVWALDLTISSEHWTRLYPTGTAPEERSGFAFAYNAGTNKLYIFDGFNYIAGMVYNDAYVLDISSLTWTEIDATGEGPSERRNACATYDYFNNNVILFGGDGGPGIGNYFNDCYVLDIEYSSSSNPEWKPSLYLNISPTINISSSMDMIRIRYILPIATKISIDILDINGRIVNKIFSGKTDLATGLISWDKKDMHNRQISAGTYFCRMSTDDMAITKKFVVVK